MSISFTIRHKESFFSLPKEIKAPVLFSLLMASTNAFLTIVMYSSLQPVIPLFYTLSQLEQQVTRKEFIFIIPGFAVTIFLVNFAFTKIFSKIDRVMMQLLCWIDVFFEFLLLFALIRIILIV